MKPQYIGTVRFDSLPEPNRGALESLLEELYGTDGSDGYYATDSPTDLSDAIREQIRMLDSFDRATGGIESVRTVSELDLSAFDSIESYVVDDGSRNFVDIVSVGLIEEERFEPGANVGPTDERVDTGSTDERVDTGSTDERVPVDEWRRQFDLLWTGAFEFVGDAQNPIDTYAHQSGSVESCLCLGLSQRWPAWDSLGDVESVEAFLAHNRERLASLSIDCDAILDGGCASLLATGDIVTAEDGETPWQTVTVIDIAPPADIQTPGWPAPATETMVTTLGTFHGLIPFFRGYRWGQARIQDLNTMETENRDNLGIVRDTDQLQSMVDSLSEINAQRELTLRIRDEQSEIERFARRLEQDNVGSAIYDEPLDQGRPEEYAPDAEESVLDAYQYVLADVLEEFSARFDVVDDNQSSTADIVQSRIDASANNANVALQDQIADSVSASSDLQRRVYVLTVVLAALTVVLVADALWSPLRTFVTDQPLQAAGLLSVLLVVSAAALAYERYVAADG